MEEKKYLNLGQKLAYGSGDLASNFAFTFISSFILIYLTDTVGLNSGTIGMLMLVSKLLDGITDVFFGTMIDRTHSKMGKARPWMFWSTFPLGICVFLQFSTPNMSTGWQYAYFFIVYTLLNAVFYTANNIAFATISALITKNNNERVQLGVFRFIFALLAALLISSMTIGLVDSFGGGATGWRSVALIYAIILIVVNTISVLCVKELPDEEGESTASGSPAKGFLKNISICIHNRYYLAILGIYIVNNMMSGISTGVGVYYMSYVLGDSSLLGLFALTGMFPMMISLAFTPLFVKKFGIYKTIVVSMAIAAVMCIPFWIAGTQKAVVPMLVFSALRGLFMGPLTGTLTTLIAEASRYSYLKDGVHIDGTMFSCSSMGIKLGGGIGSALCGWMLAIGGYDGAAAVQSAGAINMISFMYIIVPLILISALVVFSLCMNVEAGNKKLEEMASKS